MRDPARIDLVLTALRDVWVRHPDLRLGQLLMNAVRPADPCPDLFFIEDKALLHKLASLAERLRRIDVD